MRGFLSERGCGRWALLLGLACLIGSVALLCVTPPISRDALSHHLNVPKLFLKHGGMYEIPSIVFSYFPMNLDLLYMLALSFGNDVVPKYIHFAFSLLTAALLYRHVKGRLNALYGLLSALVFLSIPVIVKLSITAYVDLGLLFFTTSSLLFILEWREKAFQRKYLVFAALCCGLAVGTKYNGLISLCLLGLLVPFLRVRAEGTGGRVPFTGVVGAFLLFVTLSVLVASPWMIRNAMLTGNPVFPLYNHLFHAGTGTGSGSSIGVFEYRALAYGETGWEIALLPLRIFFQGVDNDPRYFDGVLSPLLLLFPMLAFFGGRQRPAAEKSEMWVLLGFAAAYFAIALFSSALRIRYIAPIIPPLVILSVYGINNGLRAAGRISRRPFGMMLKGLLLLVLVVFLGFHATYIVKQYEYVKPVGYLKGDVSRSEYIERYRPEYALMAYMNRTLPDRAKILFLFMGKRGYYCDRPYVFDMGNRRSLLQEAVARGKQPEKVWRALKEREISHLLMNERIFAKWTTQNFQEQELRVISDFFKKWARRIASHKGYALFELNSEEDGTRGSIEGLAYDS